MVNQQASTTCKKSSWARARKTTSLRWNKPRTSRLAILFAASTRMLRAATFLSRINKRLARLV